jgi:hypothetical protein
MLGEALLASGQFERAREQLEQAVATNMNAGSTSGLSLSLERLAETEIALANRERAKALLVQARRPAQRSALRSHLIVRLLGVEIQAAPDARVARATVIGAERQLSDATRVCEPCSMNFRVQASSACARAGDLARARRHLADAERVAGMWQGGPWAAAVWEARAALRYAEGQPAQAAALLCEAADEYVRAQRPADEARCRAAAALTT